jgi:hypothetical protein
MRLSITSQLVPSRIAKEIVRPVATDRIVTGLQAALLALIGTLV